jgi:uncharacterized protein YfiM (DUF2279 family)
MTRIQVVVGGLVGAIILLTPLVLLVLRMCRPANRARLVAASWIRVFGFLLVPLAAWVWVIFGVTRISATINGVVVIVLGILWIVTIYLVWIAAPVAAVTWIVLKLMDRGSKPAATSLILAFVAVTAGLLVIPRMAGAQETAISPSPATRRQTNPGHIGDIGLAPTAPPHEDAWFGIDKLKHFFMSAFIESVTYSALQAAHVKHRPALGGAVGVTLAVGVGREIHDSRVPGNLFSLRDLTWDAIGTAAGAVLSSHTIR